jgi:preprotein translocase subunit YajC
MTVPVAASLALLQAPGGTSIAPMLFMYGALFAIFYFVLIRPQQRQRKQHEATLGTIKRGDEIVTAGGIIGEVVNITVASKDGQPTPGLTDRVTIKSGESRLVVERGRIAKVLSTPAAGA